jgi:hypothetical protein
MSADQMMAARLLPVQCGEHDEDPADWPPSFYFPPSDAHGTGRPAPLADQRPETPFNGFMSERWHAGTLGRQHLHISGSGNSLAVPDTLAVGTSRP